MSDPIKAIVQRLRRCCAPLATAELQYGRSNRWQSLLYDGGHHHIELRVSGDGVEDAIALFRREIADDDFAIAGHIITEIRIADIDRSGDSPLLTIEAATIEA